MMTPKENAKEIYVQFFNLLYKLPGVYRIDAAKKTAMLHVNRTLEIFKEGAVFDYFTQVKKELEAI